MNYINATWHKAHKMPKNPTLTERLKWHKAHARHCACRPLHQKLADLITSKGVVELTKKSLRLGEGYNK